MHALDTPELLNAWDRGHGMSPDAWALALLHAAEPHTSIQALAALTVGQRDLALLRLRELTFGASLAGLASCPRCGSAAEFESDTASLVAVDACEALTGPLAVMLDRHTVVFRPVDTNDLLAIAPMPDLERATRALAERCILAARCDGVLVPASAVPETLIDAMAARLERIDPQADVRLALRCPSCGHGWAAAFDIVSFVWREIGAWAVRMLRSVHALASAYGWREADILALAPARRQFYLDMLAS